MEALDACLINLLCALTSPAATGLSVLVDTLEADALQRIAEVRSRKLVQLATAGPAAVILGTTAVLNEAFDAQIRPLSELLPSGAVSDCGQVGDVFASARQYVDDAQADLNEFSVALSRQLSLSDELDALELELQDQLDFFQDIRETFRNCI